MDHETNGIALLDAPRTHIAQPHISTATARQSFSAPAFRVLPEQSITRKFAYAGRSPDDGKPMYIFGPLGEITYKWDDAVHSLENTPLVFPSVKEIQSILKNCADKPLLQPFKGYQRTRFDRDTDPTNLVSVWASNFSQETGNHMVVDLRNGDTGYGPKDEYHCLVMGIFKPGI